MAEPITRGSTNAIELVGLKDRETGEYVQDATVQGDLYQSDKTTLVAGASALTVTKVEGTSGSHTMYRGRIASTVTLTLNATYWLKVTSTNPETGSVRVFWTECVAVDG